MCYICEARGNVGKNYKATQKTISEARRALGRSPAGEAGFSKSFGDGKDWTKLPPKGKRAWAPSELHAYVTKGR